MAEAVDVGLPEGPFAVDPSYVRTNGLRGMFWFFGPALLLFWLVTSPDPPAEKQRSEGPLRPLMPFALVAIGGWGVRRELRAGRRVREAASGRLVLAELELRTQHFRRGRYTFLETIRFRVPVAKGDFATAEWEVSTKQASLYTFNDNKHILAVVPPLAPGNAIVLLDSFYPLLLTETQEAQVRAALAGERKD